MVKPCGTGSAKGQEFLSGPARALLKLSSKLTILCLNLEWLSFDSETWERVIIKFNTEIWCSACLIRKWVDISPCGCRDEPWWMTGPGPFTLWLVQSTLSNGQALVTHTQQIKSHQTWQLMSSSTVWLCLTTPCLLVIPENTSLWSEERCLENFYYHYDRSRLKHSVS